jgi:hypothetical protein
MRLNVNHRALVAHTARLVNISRSALPVAVQQSLNAAAFDVKKNTMPKQSDKFVHRRPTFFKANSKVDKAKGFDINTMAATVGFVPKPNDRSHSVEDLEQQETGGKIANRAFIMLPAARVGGTMRGNIKSKYRQSAIASKIINSKNVEGGSPKIKFRNALVRAGVGGLVMGDKVYKNGNKMLWEVRKLGMGMSEKPTLIPIAVVKRNRRADIKATHFMRTASLISAKQIETVFIKVAEKKINSIR